MRGHQAQCGVHTGLIAKPFLLQVHAVGGDV
jgi:hypothetical protein